MNRPGIKAFLISCALWLIPGLFAAAITAGFLSGYEYQALSRLTGAVLEEESLPAALKQAFKENIGPQQMPDARNPADSGADDSIGIQFLQKYGYTRLDCFHQLFPRMLLICILLFQGVGCVRYLLWKRQWVRCSLRIQELADYLKAACSGEAAALTRREDIFSHLEDEIYKTAAELTTTKETAVKDHEVLAARTADIAHQLKTPLTSMSLMAELLKPTEEEDMEYLARLKSQVERLKMLSDALLTLAKLDSHTLELECREVEMNELICQAAEPLRGLFERKRITFLSRHADCPSTGLLPEVWIKADLHWTAEALLNVLKNCAEHTPENGRICLEYTQNPLYTEITVDDSGAGFSKKDLPHLFERFYRGEHAHKDSVGIGLALAKLILEKQNGLIRAENSPHGHARFVIRFYKN
ncbi:HAMP domain-containing histidine kinase [Blautia schinkii]|nr:HAMP domain-containing histidine kinase [Blautia schinkii]